ncbi:FAD-dependent oxidoreductase, partial [Oscillospiraceae bacterium OttesenSCG-928-G22]|nr:FAD-dependent oxidoreductase [Oscillospiraceae bacterium OttesenSCG-928-G22]
MNAQIAVIGGGASGLIAAVAAARNGARNVVVLERLSRPGKKLLATGNGRGNFTNASIGLANYHGKDPSFTLFPLSVFSGTDAVSFFSALGIHPRTEADGKIFPYSGQASALLDALRSELARHSVPVETEFDVSAVTRTDSGFHLSAADGRTITAD